MTFVGIRSGLLVIVERLKSSLSARARQAGLWETSSRCRSRSVADRACGGKTFVPCNATEPLHHTKFFRWELTGSCP